MTIAFIALTVIALTTFGALRFSSGRGRRRAASLAAIRAFLDANPHTPSRTLSPAGVSSTAPALEARIFFLDAYRDRAARRARSQSAAASRASSPSRTAQQHRPA